MSSCCVTHSVRQNTVEFLHFAIDTDLQFSAIVMAYLRNQSYLIVGSSQRMFYENGWNFQFC